MPVDLFKQRLADVERRLGQRPPGLYAVSREDIPDMEPLDTPEGQAWVNGLIEHLGGIDFLVLDNVMSLTTGDMKDEEPWKPVTAWMRDLTRRHVGCLWVNHTGHDATKSYGTKTREWQLDTVIIGEQVENDEADLAINLSFTKARQRTPDKSRRLCRRDIAAAGR